MNYFRILHNGDLRKDSPHPSPHWMVHLSLYWTKVATLTPLARSPLRRLDIRFTLVTTLLSLRRMLLEELSFSASRIRRGLDSLRTVGTITRINRRTAADFWGRRGGCQPSQAASRHTAAVPLPNATAQPATWSTVPNIGKPDPKR